MNKAADARLESARAFYAGQMAAASGWSDPRLREAFAAVPREGFLSPGPWHVIFEGHAVRTPDADPIHLCQNVLVAIDRDKGINNGEPSLHARWLGAVAPQPGEAVVHVGAGGGYYSAILSRLVDPGGEVIAYEVEQALAAAARENCRSLANVRIVAGNAAQEPLPAADIVYVNAGVAAPPLSWLDALKPGGRLIFPWRPAPQVGLAVLAVRTQSGFSLRVVSRAWFIPCVGAADGETTVKAPSPEEAARSRSIVPAREREPDASATAIYHDLWFSSEPPAD